MAAEFSGSVPMRKRGVAPAIHAEGWAQLILSAVAERLDEGTLA